MYITNQNKKALCIKLYQWSQSTKTRVQFQCLLVGSVSCWRFFTQRRLHSGVLLTHQVINDLKFFVAVFDYIGNVTQPSLSSWRTRKKTFSQNVLSNDQHLLFYIWPDYNNHVYSLRPRRHELTLAIKGDARNCFDRHLFKDTSWYIAVVNWLYFHYHFYCILLSSSLSLQPWSRLDYNVVMTFRFNNNNNNNHHHYLVIILGLYLHSFHLCTVAFCQPNYTH